MEPIHDHALIGDCRAAALVSWRGAIDWLCWPRFDSPSVFVALLDEKAGHWTLQPTAPFESTQRYLDGTNIIEGSPYMGQFHWFPSISYSLAGEVALKSNDTCTLSTILSPT